MNKTRFFVSVFMIAALMIVSFSGCGKEVIGNQEGMNIQNTEESNAKVGIANPMETVESVDEINSRAGVQMTDPEIGGEMLSVIKTNDGVIGEIRFEYANADFSYRAAKIEHDISGVYADFGDGITAAGDAVEKKQSPREIPDSGFYARWFDDNGVQYSLYAQGAARADFEVMYEKIKP